MPYTLKGGFHITIAKLGCLRNFMYAFRKKNQSFKKTKYITFNKPTKIILCELVTLDAYIQC